MEEVWNTERMERKMKRWTIAGIPAISVTGSLLHFVYDWSGGLTAVGLFAPVNESIWEHLKLLFWPVLVWWALGYFLFSKKEEISASRLLPSASVGLFAGVLFIVAFYYTYTGAFGFHSLFLDILSFVLGTAAVQLYGLRLYTKIKTARSWLILAASGVVLLGAVFLAFTFYPPQIPLFEDPLTGSYGI